MFCQTFAIILKKSIIIIMDKHLYIMIYSFDFKSFSFSEIMTYVTEFNKNIVNWVIGYLEYSVHNLN